MRDVEKVSLQAYLQNRIRRESEGPVYRNLCVTCLHPEFSCYCGSIEKFDPQIQFVILIHPIEFQRRIATGRMSHLILENSILRRGQNYSHDQVVNQLIADPKNHSVILYPGRNSVNLSQLTVGQKRQQFPVHKKLTVFVIDGTWATARQMLNYSENLKSLPKVCFTPQAPSRFRVRKQPEAHCLSTIEAIHQFIEITADMVNFDLKTQKHHNLLKSFDSMVERQIHFVNQYAVEGKSARYTQHKTQQTSLK